MNRLNQIHLYFSFLQSSQADFWDDSDEEDDTLSPIEISALTSGLNKVKII